MNIHQRPALKEQQNVLKTGGGIKRTLGALGGIETTLGGRWKDVEVHYETLKGGQKTFKLH